MAGLCGTELHPLIQVKREITAPFFCFLGKIFLHEILPCNVLIMRLSAFGQYSTVKHVEPPGGHID